MPEGCLDPWSQACDAVANHPISQTSRLYGEIRRGGLS